MSRKVQYFCLFDGSADGEDETTLVHISLWKKQPTWAEGSREWAEEKKTPEGGKARHDLTANSTADRCHIGLILSVAIGDTASEEANEITEPIVHFIHKQLCLFSPVENTVYHVWQYVLRTTFCQICLQR